MSLSSLLCSFLKKYKHLIKRFDFDSQTVKLEIDIPPDKKLLVIELIRCLGGGRNA